MSPVEVGKLMDLVLAEAAQCESDAGYGGEMGDRGAGVLRTQVRFYKFGQRGEVPPEWLKYQNHLDPEWAEFQRLSQKFNGRAL